MQLGVVYNYLPLMILPIFVALDRLDPALREASKDLGAGRLKTFRQVTVPLAMPGIIAGPLLVFIPLMRRLHHRRGAGRGEGQHGGADGRREVPGGAELGPGLRDGDGADRHDPGGRSGCSP